ncbi:MAG TPA: acyl-CoA dehydrogenase family protein [Xanthobacteraceae bacterium]|nr:acyl-CoA dehydrogenase family protein [Xanthobacteraceae bacterium]
MPLILNEEQVLVRDSARAFLADHGPVSHLRKLRDSRDAEGFSRALWKKFAEMGFCGVLVPEDLGGSGLGYVEAGVVMEEIGRNLTPSPFLSTSIVGATALLRDGNKARSRELLPKIAAGDLLLALAVDERAKHAPSATALRAERSGNGFALTGDKCFVVDGHVADLLIVAARSAGAPGETDGLTLFLVDAKAKGIETERSVMVDAHNAARIKFDRVQVDADAVIGEVDRGWRLLEGVLNAGRAAVAAELIGVGEGAFGRTLTYLKDRKQFGQPLGSFQALQHRAAHLFTELEITQAAVLKALQVLDSDFERAATIVSVAKARAGASATLAVQEAVQMHGGIGMTDEFDIGFFMKRARVGQELFGDAGFHADRVARSQNY